MQQLTIIQPLADLLRQSAAARAAFEARRTVAVELPAYQVKAAGDHGFYHIIDTASGKVCGFRRSYQRALEHAEILTIRRRDNIGAEG